MGWRGLKTGKKHILTQRFEERATQPSVGAAFADNLSAKTGIAEGRRQEAEGRRFFTAKSLFERFNLF